MSEQTSVAGRLQRKANNIKNATPSEAARITVAIMATERRAIRRQRNYDRCLANNLCRWKTALAFCVKCGHTAFDVKIAKTGSGPGYSWFEGEGKCRDCGYTGHHSYSNH